MDKKYVIAIEGQNIDLPAEIAADDAKVKSALAPYFPGAANAKIMRAEKDGVETVTVIKQAGTKGGIVEALIACKPSRNPVAELYEELSGVTVNSIDPKNLLELDARVKTVIKRGEEQKKAVYAAERLLEKLEARPAKMVVTGF
jgi:UPF0288 family protein (methanogenesis marker protein 3)